MERLPAFRTVNPKRQLAAFLHQGVDGILILQVKFFRQDALSQLLLNLDQAGVCGRSRSSRLGNLSLRHPLAPSLRLLRKIHHPIGFLQQLGGTGGGLGGRRQGYLVALAPLAVANYSEISSGREQLALRYLPSFGSEGLLSCCLQKRAEEIRAGFCQVGPHREDFEVTLDGRSARTYGSQGQQRSAVLSLKLAEAAQAAKIREDAPVMLLDDVLSELDEKRRAWLLTRMEGRQTIVTACDSAEFLKTSGVLYAVSGGQIRPL